MTTIAASASAGRRVPPRLAIFFAGGLGATALGLASGPSFPSAPELAGVPRVLSAVGVGAWTLAALGQFALVRACLAAARLPRAAEVAYLAAT